MYDFRSLMKEELESIESMISRLEGELSEDTVIVRKKRNNNYYYYEKAGSNEKSDGHKCSHSDSRNTGTDRGKPKLKYLGKGSSAKVQAAWTNKYRIGMLSILMDDRAAIRRALKNYVNYDRANVVCRLSASMADVRGNTAYQELMLKLFEWAKGGVKNPTVFPKSENYAANGERMRSKGESIWSILLTEAVIPFRADKKLTLMGPLGEEDVYPDFLIKCCDGHMIAVEHLGKLDDFEYAKRFVEKCQIYLRNGFVIGDNLILTSDDVNYGTNAKMIAEKVREIERKFYSRLYAAV